MSANNIITQGDFRVAAGCEALLLMSKAIPFSFKAVFCLSCPVFLSPQSVLGPTLCFHKETTDDDTWRSPAEAREVSGRQTTTIEGAGHLWDAHAL